MFDRIKNLVCEFFQREPIPQATPEPLIWEDAGVLYAQMHSPGVFVLSLQSRGRVTVIFEGLLEGVLRKQTWTHEGTLQAGIWLFSISWDVAISHLSLRPLRIA